MERDDYKSSYPRYGRHGAQPAEPPGQSSRASSLTYNLTYDDDAANVNSMAQRVEIVVQGHLDASWSVWFDGLTIEQIAGGRTVLRGVLPDQAALHGMLARVRDLGLPLRALTADPYCPAPERIEAERSK
jgi:hypothetical protein